MDGDTDPGFLVVDLEQCVSADIRNINKNIYCNSLSPTSCHDVIQVGTTVQDLNQPVSRIQHHPLTQLQPVHYQQVNYDGSSNHGFSSLFHNPSLQSYSPAPGYSSPFLHTLSPVDHSNITVPTTSTSPVLNPPPTPPPMPPPPKERKKHSPPDPNDTPQFPINDYEYYKEIEQLLVMDKYPEGVSDNYKKHLRKRARHYLIIDCVLYHNPKKPKKVVMRKLEQMNLLESTHIMPESGVHLGIKKMLDMIHGEYFWRGLYEDVANFVNNCAKCRDSVDLAQRREQEFRRLGEDFSDDEMEYAYASTSVQTSSVVWERVEIQMHGPFKCTESRNEYVLTITDPESCFVHATPLPQVDCAVHITDFILKTFYTFGFPQPYFVSSKELYEEVVIEYDSRLKQKAWKAKLHRMESSDVPWVSQLAELLIVRKTDCWDKEMDKFMFQFRAGCIRHSLCPKDSAPFYSMFQRLPFVDDKENFDTRNRGRNHFQCEDCDDMFVSKVALKLHKKKHSLEEARKTSLIEYAIEKHELQHGDEFDKSRVEDAMGEIKNYLAKTKDMRRKRGKYQKYSVELQEHMIAYARNNGVQKASTYFTELIGSNVSDSTIRNLLKTSVHFSPRTKEEIAHYAVEYGVDKASKHFTEILKKDVPLSLVSKFKILYGSKFLKQDKENSRKHKIDNKSIYNLTNEDKESIGKFACSHNIQETISFFSKKINIDLSEKDIEELHRFYLEKQRGSSFVESPSESPKISNVTYQALPAGSVCFSPSGSIVQIQDTSYSFEDVEYNQPLLHREGIMVLQQHPDKVGECSTAEGYLLPSEDSSNPCEISSTSDQSKGSRKLQSWSNQCHQESSSSEFQRKEIETTVEFTSHPNKKQFSKPKTKNNPKKKQVGKKRGSYTMYSPELRAKIGKYAAEHGSLKASNHFSKILGHDLPESTARGLKEKYLNKVRHCDVTSLGYSNRGRPLMLGKYDEIVQGCLRKLASSGERMTSFLAITTAKQILNKFEPGLLQENGGTIVLNNNWAKSILKRVGVRNNS